MFDIKGKVALVTGGASGIGLCYIRELLSSGVKGATLVDVNSDTAQIALGKIEKEFGPNRVQFVKADVSDIKQLEDAFKKTVEAFGYLDIVINNAGIFNDKKSEIGIAVNFTAVVHGILLGLENYLPKHKQGPEAVIVNTASIFGLQAVPGCPVYSAAKAGVIALTRCWGHSYHYERTKVRLFAVCPGVTLTAILEDTAGRSFGEAYDKWFESGMDELDSQKPEHVAKEVVKLIQSSPNGSIWVVEGGKQSYQFIPPERTTMLK